jgi:putative hydrolase of the HAD superfamily
VTPGRAAAARYHRPVSFPVRAITLDLDDTLWPFAPIGARIEHALHDWLGEHSPATAERFPPHEMLRLREQVAAGHPELAHDLTAIRRRDRDRAGRKRQRPALLEPAFEVFTPAATRWISTRTAWPGCAGWPHACR